MKPRWCDRGLITAQTLTWCVKLRDSGPVTPLRGGGHSTCLCASRRKLFQMARRPAEVSMGRHSAEPVDLEGLSSDAKRFTSTTESYSARKRQLEKNPGRIWSATSRSSLAIPDFPLPLRMLRTLLSIARKAASSVSPLIVTAMTRGCGRERGRRIRCLENAR